jgi:hypothetical protein
LIQNWKQTELGKRYDLFQDEDGNGQQYPTDTGPIDILAISKDKKELLVVELKKGRASDSVVGQIQRYMGYVLDELAEENQRSAELSSRSKTTSASAAPCGLRRTLSSTATRSAFGCLKHEKFHRCRMALCSAR